MKLLGVKNKVLPFIVGLIFSITLAIIVLRGLLFIPGRLDTGDLSFFNDIGWYRQEHSWADICSLPYIHQHYILLYPLSWLVNDVGNLARLTYFVIFVVMAFTSYTVVFAQTVSKCKRIESCYAAAFTASAIYTLNPYVLGIVGWFFNLFGYAIFPLFIYFIPKVITTPSRWKAVQYALISALFLALELINAYEFTVSFLFCLLILLTITIIRIKEKPKESLLRFTLSTLTILIVPPLLGAFILLPSFVLGGTVIPWSPLQLWQLYAPGWANFKLYDVFRLWKWSTETTPMKTNILTQTSSLIVPIAAWLFLIAILVKKRLTVTVERTQKQFTCTIKVKECLTAIVDQHVKWVILIISIVGILVTMGVSGPLGSIIVWASFNIPFATFKRTEFWIKFLSLSYSLLCGFLIAEICERKKSDAEPRNLPTLNKFIKRLKANKTAIFLAFILVTSTSFAGPDSPFQALSGNFGRLINPAKVPSCYDDLNEWLSSQKDEFRTLWLPFRPPTWGAESTFNFPSPIAAWLSSRPVVVAHQPNERDYMSFSLKFMGEERLSNFLGLFGVKYIIFHNDTEDYEANRIIYQNLTQNNELELVYQRDFLYVFRNKQFQPYLTSFNSKILSISSLKALNLSYYIPEFNPMNQAIIFPEQYVNLTKRSIQILQKDDILLFYGHNFTDLVLSNLDPRYIYAPLDYMKHNIDYWFAEVEGANFNNDFSYGKGVIFSNTNGLRFSMDVDAESSTNYQIWVRFYAAPSTGGEVDIFIDGTKVGSVNEDIHPSESRFIWTKIAECWLTEGRHKLTFVNRNTDKIPNVNLITVVPSVEMKNSRNTLLDVIEKSNVRLVYVLNERDIKISDPRSLPSSITIFDNDNLTFFNPIAWGENGLIGEPVLSNENALKIQVGNGNYKFWGIVHNYTSNQNWNNNSFLLLYWYGNSTGQPITVRVRAPDENNSFIYDFLDDFNGWKHLALPLDSFAAYIGNPSWEYVRQIALLTRGSAVNVTGTWALDYIGLTDLLAKNTMVYVPRNRNYTVAIRTTDSVGKANITLGIDLEQIDKPTHKETFQNLTSYYFLLRNLTEGSHNLTVFIKEPVNIESIVVFSVDNSSITTLSDVFKNRETSPIIKYEKVSSEKWIVEVNTSKPFMLAFSEPYYDLWQSSAEGTIFNNFPLFSQINGYFINKSGKYVIQIHFTLQKFMRDGLIISGTTLFLTIILLAFIEYKIRKKSARA